MNGADDWLINMYDQIKHAREERFVSAIKILRAKCELGSCPRINTCALCSWASHGAAAS